MKINTLIIPALALAAGSFLIPSDSEGFSLLGHNLTLIQRDLRVFNNFTDSSANNNTIAHSQFPGYDGAEMAFWKSAVEWGSRAHGNGSGDPQQNFGLGTGGANFDPSWQGNALGIGTTNQNVISELNGNGGMVLAFAESNGGIGWRIRFYSNWVWSDGPNNVFSQEDMQGVGCHEYGHALGMGHSVAGGSPTMGAVASGNGYTDRSIAADDILGIRAIYGTASAAKPIISGHNLCGTTLEITGSNFSTTTNTIWFTQAGIGGTGQPVKITNIPSTAGGTMLTVNVPVNAGSGDILVQNLGGGHANLSNAWPFDVNLEGNCVMLLTPFCFGDATAPAGCGLCPCSNNAMSGTSGGCLNSTGNFATLIASGLPEISNDTLEFNITGANSSSLGVLLSGSVQLPNNVANPCPAGAGVPTPVYDGLRCIGQGILRHGNRALTSGANNNPWGGPGAPNNGFAQQSGFIAGQSRHWQAVYRDNPAVACNTGLNTTNGIGMVWTP